MQAELEAGKELAAAKERAPDSAEVVKAGEALQQGLPFTAWLLARSAAVEPPIKPSDGVPWALCVGAAAILILLAWVFSRGPKQKELRDME
jgi:hypothetical protein